MRTRLGLDIGTSSIGWCLYEGESIRDAGVRIFSDGRDPKLGTSLAVDRRLARSARRRRDRYLGRRSALLDTLVKVGLMPVELADAKAMARQDPYDLRRRAINEELHPFEIGRALFHLNQRRGFKSNRKAERRSDDKNDGKIAPAIRALDQKMKEAGTLTLGAFLAGRKTKRCRIDALADGYDFYPERRHLEDEFDHLWKKQKDYHPQLLTDEAEAIIRRIIFYQRPLKEQQVGRCTFVENETRLPKAHPLFQERRLYEEINQLRITSIGATSRTLTLAERDRLVLKMRSTRQASFSSLGTLIKLAQHEGFNKESESRSKLKGDEISAQMLDKKRFGQRWAHLDMAERWGIVSRIIDEEDPVSLQTWLTGTNRLSHEQAAAVASIHLPEGYSRLGKTANHRILEELRKAVITYDEAARIAFGHHSDFRTGEILDELPYYGRILEREIPPGSSNPEDPDEVRFGKVTNPTVHIGLRQLQKLINTLIRTHGRPDEIVVELARELKLNEEQKKAHRDRVAKDTKAAEARSKKLSECRQIDSGANRMLLRLWEELNPTNPLDRRCPYCSQQIGLTMLFDGQIDVDHILPFSRTLDDSTANKVVTHRHCNREKGNRSPFEAWGDSDRWLIIQEQISRLSKAKQWRFSPDSMERFQGENDFIARQLTDTQYLAKMARTYLSKLYPEDSHVYVIPGRMTAMLRRLWGLNALLPDHNYVENRHSNAPKNRLDHRHHVIDAAVIGATNRSLLNAIAKAAGRAEDLHLDRLFKDLPMPWQGFRDELRDRLESIVVSHKADHGLKGRPKRGQDVTSGRLHNDTAYGVTGLKKRNLPIVRHRVPLTQLKPRDLENPDRIVDTLLRSKLVEATSGLPIKDFAKALTAFAENDPVYQGIRRVRLREPLKIIPIRDKTGQTYKAYKGDANARFDVWRLPDGKWIADVISMFEAHQHDTIKARRPHPAAKKVLSLRQNDLIAIEQDSNIRRIMRVAMFSLSGQITLVDHHEAGNLRDRNRKPNDVDPLKYMSPTAGGLLKLKARQVRVDELGQISDPGPR